MGFMSIVTEWSTATDLLLAYEQQKEIPQAVVCANDVMAAGIIDGLSDTPLQNKIAVTGFDHYYDGELFSPTITSIRRPREEVAFDGVKLLHEMVEKNMQILFTGIVRTKLLLGEHVDAKMFMRRKIMLLFVKRCS